VVVGADVDSLHIISDSLVGHMIVLEMVVSDMQGLVTGCGHQ